MISTLEENYVFYFVTFGIGCSLFLFNVYKYSLTPSLQIMTIQYTIVLQACWEIFLCLVQVYNCLRPFWVFLFLGCWVYKRNLIRIMIFSFASFSYFDIPISVWFMKNQNIFRLVISLLPISLVILSVYLPTTFWLLAWWIFFLLVK